MQTHRESPLDENTPKYLAKGIALFEMTDDELLPIRVIGIQVTTKTRQAATTVWMGFPSVDLGSACVRWFGAAFGVKRILPLL